MPATPFLTLVIPADGTLPVRTELAAGLEDLQRLVGGWIEPASADEWTAFVNEEGKLLGLSFNARAHQLLHSTIPLASDDLVVGDVVIVGPVDQSGSTTSAPAGLVAELVQGGRR